ncbi:MAG: cation diffusion facilitator family transporter [Bacilli bacterium]|jgi:cation diffusion facilitator family transporter|nr:cation diffusion facilitator family transporter [Bacilli bacterium]
MIKLLGKIFIKDYNNYTNTKVRNKYGILSGVFGIISNLLISVGKIIVGLVFGSVSILADGINSLSDMGTSIITVISYHFAGTPPDKEHPFGHQRIEQISGLLLSAIVMVIGVSLLKTSIKNIFTPQTMVFSYIAIIILVISLFVKIIQSIFYFRLGKIINSKVLKANAFDSLNDCLSTIAVIIAYLIFHFWSINLDAYLGIVVSLFVIYSGFKLIKSTISPLIGEAPDRELVTHIENKLLSYKGVLGIHDLVIHTYGVGNIFVTVHVEVKSDADFVECHDMIDNIERDFYHDDAINLVIHMDPTEKDTEESIRIKELIAKILYDINEKLSFHDFRVVSGPTHTNVIFDIVVPQDFLLSDRLLIKEVKERMLEIDKKISLVINIDHNYLI